MLLMSKFTWPGEAGVPKLECCGLVAAGQRRPQVTGQRSVSDGGLNRLCLEMLGSIPECSAQTHLFFTRANVAFPQYTSLTHVIEQTMYDLHSHAHST